MMGIFGLTHDANGVALEKLPVAMKVAIGQGLEEMQRRLNECCECAQRICLTIGVHAKIWER